MSYIQIHVISRPAVPLRVD